MPTTARAAVYRGPETFVVESFPLPSIGNNDMFGCVSLCGVDGSELAMFHGANEYLNERVPVIFGDEVVGIVQEIGLTGVLR